MARLEGKVVLVTGAARGLGACDAEWIAREGGRVILTDVLDGAETAERIGGRFLPQDVCDEAGWIDLIARIERDYGRLDGLVNNAGIVIPGTIESATLEDFRKVCAVSSEGTFLGCKHAIPLMRKGGGGSIVNMSSLAALRSFSATLGYAAAKGAIRSMTKVIAGYCLEQGYAIRCNSIHPGTIDTEMVRGMRAATEPAEPAPPVALPPGTRAPLVLGVPDDIAALVVYLLADESRFMTGQELVVDNGYTIQ